MILLMSLCTGQFLLMHAPLIEGDETVCLVFTTFVKV